MEVSSIDKPKKVLVLGSGALKIGEAGEFDFSGSQCLKSLREEGIRTVLVNPNIATIQTDKRMADRIYLLPVNPAFVESVIERERPDGILLGFGGQTALNCGLALEESGVLAKYSVKVLGTPVEAIRNTEDRELFVHKLAEIGVKVPKSVAATAVEAALKAAASLGYPVIIRSAYSLGGQGSGICRDDAELQEKAEVALAGTRQILVEEYLGGWKEIEYEVVRDQYDNCITVCNMENVDPLGIHTGESIVVAPSQTLSNSEYHRLRELSIRVIRHMGIVGECNIQFALDPQSEECMVIEVNARLSRSSALASKATGYPLAFVAAKLALGYSLPELRNSITKSTTACFEPALDYIVVKVPRWDLKKFRNVSKAISSGMKSVGEVMAIGRSFEEALQKALRMLDIGMEGFAGNSLAFADIDSELQNPTDERIFAVAEALRKGYSIERIHELSRIDRWYVQRMQHIIAVESMLGKEVLSAGLLREAKLAGFSDRQVALLAEKKEEEVRALRENEGIRPVVKQIDTLAAEYPAATNYLYLTYHGSEDDVEARQNGRTAVVLGSGAYRIGSSVEFDWCCVNAVVALRQLGYTTVMVNCNPETVSTDYDECDKLYFDELSCETVLEICGREQPTGVVVSMGGQIPNTLAVRLNAAGVPLLGTDARNIDRAEDRYKFSSLLDELGVEQPEWKELTSMRDAESFAEEVGYPVLVRPSYVLSGAAMGVVERHEDLEAYLRKAAKVNVKYPVVISKFITNAREIEIDAVAMKGELLVWAVTEHVENAGVHSGDATMTLPPQKTYLVTVKRVEDITRKVAAALQITGPFNIQFLAKENAVKVIECNLRASRSFPFVSKVMKVNFVDAAVKAMLGMKAPSGAPFSSIGYVGVKAPQFSFARLTGADPVTSVEMASTGEVACLGDDQYEALLKAMIATGFSLPEKSVLLTIGSETDKVKMLETAKKLQGMGLEICATANTADFLAARGVKSTKLYKVGEKRSPNIYEYLTKKKLDLVINIKRGHSEQEKTDGYVIRRTAADFNIPLITNVQLARVVVESLARLNSGMLRIRAWDEY